MITEKDLVEAIAECQGTRNPNANTCLKLAAYYTILDHVKPEEEQPDRSAVVPQYSFSPPPEQGYSSETEFGLLLNKKETNDVLECIDELMETLRIMQPKLYRAFIRKITAL